MGLLLSVLLDGQVLGGAQTGRMDPLLALGNLPQAGTQKVGPEVVTT